MEMAQCHIVKGRKDRRVHVVRPTDTDLEDFETVSNYVNHKIKELGTCVLDGDIRLNPYEQKDQNACTYCVYKSVCGFDRKLGAGLVRRLEELDAQEAIEKMKEDGGK